MFSRSQRSEARHRVRLAVEELETRTVPSVLTPAQVRHAYGFDQIKFSVNGQSIVGDGSGQTIAIVNAYDNPRIFSDLDTFDKAFSINGKQTLYQQYGAANSFLTKVNAQGSAGTDPSGGVWNLETALDVEWAHAIAPGAKILLVQARSSSYTDLFGAVDYARNQPGVVVVSMSWGSAEWSGETRYDFHFTTPSGHLGGSDGRGGTKLAGGVTFVAASGDQGKPGLWPALSVNVLAVGGTTLSVDAAGNYKGETAWSGSGGGVSTYEQEPAYQSAVNTTGKRTIPDVAYNGNPSSGVYVYDSMPLNGKTGTWWQVGGTSAGAPQWAALIAIVDQGRALQGKGSLDGPSQTLPAIYNLPAGDFHDIVSGSNGNAAKAGYDLATGRGSPIANRVVADLVRADNRGTLNGSTTSKSGGTSTATGTVKPHLVFADVSMDGTSDASARSITVTIHFGASADAAAVLVRASAAPGASSTRRSGTTMASDATGVETRAVVALSGFARVSSGTGSEVTPAIHWESTLAPEAAPAPAATQDDESRIAPTAIEDGSGIVWQMTSVDRRIGADRDGDADQWVCEPSREWLQGFALALVAGGSGRLKSPRKEDRE